jgi:nitrogen regulatory protein PII-like uncharacterized protein
MKYLILSTSDGTEVTVHGPYQAKDEEVAYEHASDMSAENQTTTFVVDEETVKEIAKAIKGKAEQIGDDADDEE